MQGSHNVLLNHPSPSKRYAFISGEDEPVMDVVVSSTFFAIWRLTRVCSHPSLTYPMVWQLEPPSLLRIPQVEGDAVKHAGQIVGVPVGPELLGCADDAH